MTPMIWRPIPAARWFLVAFGLVLVAWNGGVYLREQVAVDVCVDAGGSFDYRRYACDRVDSHPHIPYMQRHGAAVAGSAVGVAFVVVALWTRGLSRPR